MLQISVFSFNFEGLLSCKACLLMIDSVFGKVFIALSFLNDSFAVNILDLAFKNLFYNTLNQPPSTPGL